MQKRDRRLLLAGIQRQVTQSNPGIYNSRPRIFPFLSTWTHMAPKGEKQRLLNFIMGYFS